MRANLLTCCAMMLLAGVTLVANPNVPGGAGEPEAVFRKFCEAIHKGDVDTAYALGTKKPGETKADLKEAFTMVRGMTPRRFEATEKTMTATTCTLKGKAWMEPGTASQKPTSECVVKLVKQQGQWLVDGVEIGEKYEIKDSSKKSAPAGKKPASGAASVPAGILAAEELTKAFLSNAKTAEGKYKQKEVVVKGTITKIDAKADAFPCLALQGHQSSVIKCKFINPKDLAPVKVGQVVTIEATVFTWRAGTLELVMCSIKE